MGVKTYIKNIKEALDSTFEGMGITLSNLLQRPVTYDYYAYGDPKRMPKLLEKAGLKDYSETISQGYRGILEVDIDTCTGCSLCEKACPIDCIIILKGKNEDKRITVERFAIDNSKCMYCGLCSIPCPTGAIKHTKEFEASNYYLENLVFEWAPEGGYVAYNAKKDGERERAELGSRIAEKIKEATYEPKDRFPKKVKPPKPEKVKLKAPPLLVGNRKSRTPKEEAVAEKDVISSKKEETKNDVKIKDSASKEKNINKKEALETKKESQNSDKTVDNPKE